MTFVLINALLLVGGLDMLAVTSVKLTPLALASARFDSSAKVEWA